jgi:hypothetical protein
MRKGALIAVVATAASLTCAAETDPAAASAAAAVGCHSSPPLDPACATHPLEASGDGTVPPADAVAFASSAASSPDWTPLRPPQHAGLDFKDAATEPPLPAPLPPDHNGPPPLILALLALAALVILLRRKPR